MLCVAMNCWLEQLVAQRNALDERGEDFSEKVARENPPSCNSASALEAANQVGSAVRDKVFWDKAAAAMATEDRTQEDVATLAHALVRLSGSATEAAYVIPVLEEAAEDFTVAKAEADAAEQAAAAAELVAKKNDVRRDMLSKPRRSTYVACNKADVQMLACNTIFDVLASRTD